MVHTALAIPKNTSDDVEENPGPTMFDIIDPKPLCLLTLVKEMKQPLV